MAAPSATPTQQSPTQSVAGKRAPMRVWGDKGVSERFIVQDVQLAPTPLAQQLPLADAGLLSELQHHISGTVTISGTTARDVYGPYDITNVYSFFAGSNTPLISLSGRALGNLQILEYPQQNTEVQEADPSVQNPLTNTTDLFNFPNTTGIFRHWIRVPLALRLMGVRGGYVGYIVLQNKRIQNVVKPTFNLTGAASPYSAIAASGFGASPYTGAGTVTIAPTFETWKLLNTVPRSRSQMPVFGFTRYIQEIQQAYTNNSFTYTFEPGGELLRAMFQFVDNTVGGGMATSNLTSIAFSYGTNKQVDVYTPYRNLQEQLQTYGRTLTQGTFVFDYYTKFRNLVNTKSTENTANVQVIATFPSSYSVPAGSVANILLDKLFVIQNYLGK